MQPYYHKNDFYGDNKIKFEAQEQETISKSQNISYEKNKLDKKFEEMDKFFTEGIRKNSCFEELIEDKRFKNLIEDNEIKKENHVNNNNNNAIDIDIAIANTNTNQDNKIN